MKKLAGLVIILAAVLLGGYYGMGVMTERTVKRDLNIVNKSNGLYAEVVKYDRGWFVSNAVVNWRLHVPGRIVKAANGQSQTIPAQDFQTQTPLTIYHGPIIFSKKGVKFGLGYSYTHFLLPDNLNAELKNSFTAESTSPSFDVDLFVNYLNKSTINLDVPAFKLISKEGNRKFEWKGMSSSLGLSEDLNKFKGHFDIDGMTFSNDQANVQIGKISNQYDLYRSNSGLFVGDASVSIPSIIIMEKDKKIFELVQFDLSSSTAVNGGLVNAEFKSSLDKIIAKDKTYGPGRLVMSLKNLDAEAADKINQLHIKSMQQDSELDRQKTLLMILPELPKLVSQGPAFEISELSFVVPEGTIEGNLIFSLPKGDTSNPFELMQKVEGSGKLKVPAAVLKQILASANAQKNEATVNPQVIAQQMATAGNGTQQPSQDGQATQTAKPDVAAETEQQISKMLTSGLIVQQGSDYVINFDFKQSRLNVNGKPFNPEMMKF